MFLDLFIENSEASNNSNKILTKSEFINMKEDILNTFDYVYLPTFRIFKKVEVKEEGINRAILEAQYGIAETGTVVFISSAEYPRRASMLALHVTFALSKSNIVETLEGISKKLEMEFREKPNYISFITGPSRTADIENQLIIGVHGPISQEILIID
jgi:L-lactate dehydrogenase complex protein LldG